MNGLLRAAGLAGGLVLATLCGCASNTLDLYARETPSLDLQSYFQGPVTGQGIFTDRAGRVVKRFSVRMQCQWSGEQGVLDEDFTYSDGAKQKRVWRIQRLADGRFEGRADDVIGIAQGEAKGNAFHWTYTLAQPVDGTVYEVQMDDWMYRMTDTVILNKTTMRKFGVTLGEVTLSFQKP